MPRQWDKGTQADPGHRRPLRIRCDGGLAKISRRHSDRASPPVGKLHNDVGGTSCRALRQHRKLAAKQGMSRVSNRDMGHHPIEDCGALQCTVTQPTLMPSSTAWSITLTGSISTGKACGEPVNPTERPEQMALWTCRCAWTTRRALPTCPQQTQQQTTKSSSRDSRLTLRLRRCQKPTRQNASRPGRHQNRNGGRDHLGILGEIKSVHPGEIIGIRRLRRSSGNLTSKLPHPGTASCLIMRMRSVIAGRLLELPPQLPPNCLGRGGTGGDVDGFC
jgi:hypothetical protein